MSSFAAGFFGSLANTMQSRLDDKREAAKEERRMRLTRELELEYSRNSRVEKRADGYYKIVENGNGQPIEALTRKLNDMEQQAIEAGALKNQAEMVESKDRVENYGLDQKAKRDRAAELFNLKKQQAQDSHLNAGVYRAQAGLSMQESKQRMAANEPVDLSKLNPEQLEQAKAKSLLTELSPMINAAIATAQKNGNPISRMDIEEAAKAAVANSRTAEEAKSRLSLSLRDLLRTSDITPRATASSQIIKE